MSTTVATDPLDGFTKFEFTDGGTTHDVYRTGSGPAVIVIHEVPGVTPKVAEFGRRVAAIGCTAVLPSLFGTPGRAPSTPYILQSISGACVSQEFHDVGARAHVADHGMAACARRDDARGMRRTRRRRGRHVLHRQLRARR